MAWSEICSQGEFRGRWVALDGVRYDELTHRPTQGIVVDVDDDLADLCNRMREANRRCCAILFCDNARDHARPASRLARVRAALSH